MSDFKQLIRHGKYSEIQKERVIKYISELIIAEKLEYEVIVKRYSKSKTKEQLGYYWGVVIPHFMKFHGYSSKDADVVLKEELCPPVIIQSFGRVIETRVSIADMKATEMREYIDSCVNFLGTWGVNVPPPPYKPNRYD